MKVREPVAAKPSDKKLTFEEALIPSPVPKQEKQEKIVETPDRSLIEAESCYAQAEKDYEDGNYGKAAFQCKEALRHRQDAKYYHLLGAAYARHPRFQKDAEEAFHKAISLAPKNPEYHVVVAAFYSQRQLWLRARTHCQKAVELDATHKLANELFRKVMDQKLGKGDCWCVGSTSPTE